MLGHAAKRGVMVTREIPHVGLGGGSATGDDSCGAAVVVVFVFVDGVFAVIVAGVAGEDMVVVSEVGSVFAWVVEGSTGFDVTDDDVCLCGQCCGVAGWDGACLSGVGGCPAVVVGRGRVVCGVVGSGIPTP